MKGIIFSLLVIVHISDGVIYRLNDTEYLRMPPLYYLDDYDSCVYQPNGTYCYVDFDLVSDTPSDLLQMIQEYSKHRISHFNHTHLNRGVCLLKTCKNFLQGNKTEDHRVTLERCLNESLWRDYELKTRLTRVSCSKKNEPMDINVGDIAAAVFFIFLILFNVIGSLYDFIFVKKGKGNSFLLSFSIKRNWKKLISQDDQDQNKRRLRSIHGIRTLTVMLVVQAHAPVMLVLNTENPHEFEKAYDYIWNHILANGSIIVQSFFVIAGCLLAFNIKVYAEKNELNWTLIPKGIILRWLRLTPAYAVVLIFTLTWMRFMASGPLWETVVGAEVRDCHHDGWMNMIYINNYLDNSQCMAQTWYLASDMQLFIMGLFVCVLTKTERSRKIVLSVLFTIGLVVPGIMTYVNDLDAFVTFSPETSRRIFVVDPTFNESKRGHTNIPAFVIGMALGNLFYTGFEDEKKIKSFKKLGLTYKLTVPFGIALLLSGIVFYQDRPRFPVYVRAIVATLIRPVFCSLLAILLIGMVFKFENLYRRILEWHGWRVPARVSYSAYIIHVPIVRILGGMTSTLQRMGLPQCIKEGLAMITISFLVAYPFWLFVEAPLNRAVLHIVGYLFNHKNYNEAQKIDSEKKQMEQETVIEVSDRNQEDNLRL